MLYIPEIGYLDVNTVFCMETALWRRLLWFFCTVSHECNTPHSNTDIDVVLFVCFFLPYLNDSIIKFQYHFEKGS